jgi:hypothetical protein
MMNQYEYWLQKITDAGIMVDESSLMLMTTLTAFMPRMATNRSFLSTAAGP